MTEILGSSTPSVNQSLAAAPPPSVERPPDRATDVEGAAAAARARGLDQLAKRVETEGA